MGTLKTIWADPVWSKVIAGIILAVGGVALTIGMGWWPSMVGHLTSFASFLGATSPVPNWLVGVGIVCSTLIIFIIGGVIWVAVRPDKAEPWRGYTSAIFFDLQWNWHYTESGDVFGIHPLCKNCQYQLHPHNESPFRAIPSFAFRCDVCGNLIGPFEGEPTDLESKVLRLIHRGLRTQSWKEPGSQVAK